MQPSPFRLTADILTSALIDKLIRAPLNAASGPTAQQQKRSHLARNAFAHLLWRFYSRSLRSQRLGGEKMLLTAERGPQPAPLLYCSTVLLFISLSGRRPHLLLKKICDDIVILANLPPANR